MMLSEASISPHSKMKKLILVGPTLSADAHLLYFPVHKTVQQKVQPANSCCSAQPLLQLRQLNILVNDASLLWCMQYFLDELQSTGRRDVSISAIPRLHVWITTVSDYTQTGLRISSHHPKFWQHSETSFSL